MFARVRRVLLLAIAVWGCGKTPAPVDAGVDAGPPDAGPTCLDPDAGTVADAGATSDGGDFGCRGQPLPRGAVASFTVDGLVTAPAGFSRVNVDGALIELFGANGTVLASTDSRDAGRYALSAEIGCEPLDGYVRGSKPDAGFYDIYYYPPAPWRRSRSSLELVILDDAARNLVSMIANVMIMNGTAVLALGVNDCAGEPVVGATVTSVPAGDVRYVAPNGIPTDQDMATTSKGQLLIFNLPPGPVQVTATARGTTFTVRTVIGRADAITSTNLTP